MPSAARRYRPTPAPIYERGKIGQVLRGLPVIGPILQGNERNRRVADYARRYPKVARMGIAYPEKVYGHAYGQAANQAATLVVGGKIFGKNIYGKRGSGRSGNTYRYSRRKYSWY